MYEYFLLHVTNCLFHLFHWALEHKLQEWFSNQRPLCYEFNRFILLRNLCWFRNAPISLSSAERKLNCLGKQKYAVWPMAPLGIDTISVISNLIFRGISISTVLSGKLLKPELVFFFVSKCNAILMKSIAFMNASKGILNLPTSSLHLCSPFKQNC